MVAEYNIIGEMLVSPDIISDVSTILEPQMFQSALLGRVFFEIVKCYQDGKVITADYLVQKASGSDYPADIVERELGNAVENAPLSLYYKTDAELIYDAYSARQLDNLLAHTEVSGGNVYDQIEKLRSGLDEITRSKSEVRSVNEIAEEYKSNYFKKQDRPLMKTGFAFLDKIIGGLEGGDVIAIGARPAVGKSAFGIQMASQIADNGFKVQIFNLEMTEKQIYERLASYESGISVNRLRTAEQFQTTEERVLFENANLKLASRENMIISTGSKTVSQIHREAKQTKPEIVIIDYLQLLKSEGSYRGNRYAEVGAISHAIKQLAVELKIPVVILVQLNRMSEGKDDREPTMAEIRESGDIEQDASLIILLWNKDREDRSKKGCKIEKNRNGETGKIELMFNGAEMRFVDTDFQTVTKEQVEELPFLADEDE